MKILLFFQPDLNRRTLFLTDKTSKKVITCASNVNEAPKFLPTMHYHYPSPNLY